MSKSLEELDDKLSKLIEQHNTLILEFDAIKKVDSCQDDLLKEILQRLEANNIPPLEVRIFK